MAAHESGVERFFYSSSACVYAADKQTVGRRHRARGGRRLPGDARGRLRLGEAVQRADVPALPRGLRARDARRPLPQRLRPARHLRRRPREGAGGDLPQGHRRRSSPATHEIEIWGDGEQTRSFMYIDDCLDGTQHDHATATSSSRSTSAATSWSRSTSSSTSSRTSPASSSSGRYKLDAPKGVRGRNSDNTLIKERLGWAPSIPLRDGMEQTYRWIYDELTAGVPV